MNYILQHLSDVRCTLRRLRLPTAERGATATEYSLLVGFIALAIVVGVGAVGLALNGEYAALANELKTALGLP